MASPILHRCGSVAHLAGALMLGAALMGCNTRQSALHPAGEDAQQVVTLFWFMGGAGALIWLIVMGCAIYAVLGRNRPATERFADRFIVVGGVLFPTIALALLLVFGLSLLPNWSDDEPPDLRIHVAAEQYWWRVAYQQPDGTRVETANEVHLPLGATAEFVLTSPDVIHSFWIPALGGKMDAIPGRTNILRLTPSKAGVYRGVCAEFCGPSHALMALDVVVHEPAAFEAWLTHQLNEASADATAFRQAGCAGCHTIRGISTASARGPDLTHFGSRRTLAAGSLAKTPENLRRWLTNPTGTKPGTHMPGFAMLPDAELDALVAYLGALR